MVRLGFPIQAILFLAVGFTLGVTVAFAHAKGEQEGMVSAFLDNSAKCLGEQKI